jgi:hypothetical protein
MAERGASRPVIVTRTGSPAFNVANSVSGTKNRTFRFSGGSSETIGVPMLTNSPSR